MGFSIESFSSAVGAERMFEEVLTHALCVGTIESNSELACCECKCGGEAAFVCKFACSSDMIALVVGADIAVPWV